MIEPSSQFELREGVLVSPDVIERFSKFEEAYIGLRKKENKLLSIAEIRSLPNLRSDHPDKKTWQRREKSVGRILDHLGRRSSLKILEIGCGNGYLSAQIAKRNHKVYGLDVNLFELRQAADAFGADNITWYCADILHDTLPDAPFELIIFAASFHYFKDPVALIECCRQMLTANGEIHIFDSPFYSENEVVHAKQRSLDYFTASSAAPLSDFYSHNTLRVLQAYKPRMLYKPRPLLQRLLRIKDSPFPWLMIRP
jgi:SAM-dependent methyltransferase